MKKTDLCDMLSGVLIVVLVTCIVCSVVLAVFTTK
jgi:hypothetical protein